MECIVIAGIMKNATMKGLIAFDFGSFVKSKRAVAQIIFRQSLPHSIRKVFSLFAGAPSPTLLRVPLHLNVRPTLPAPGAQAEMYSHIHLPHMWENA